MVFTHACYYRLFPQGSTYQHDFELQLLCLPFLPTNPLMYSFSDPSKGIRGFVSITMVLGNSSQAQPYYLQISFCQSQFKFSRILETDMDTNVLFLVREIVMYLLKYFQS